MEEEGRFNPPKFEILKKPPEDIVPLLFLEEREAKPLSFETLPPRVRELFQEKEGVRVISYNQKVLILTPEGFEKGKRKFEEVAEEVASLLQDLGQKEATLFPFGSLAKGLWVGGNEKEGLAIDPETGKILHYKSDIDIGILIKGKLSPKLRAVIRGESPLPEKYAPLLKKELHVRIINPREKGVFVYSLFLEQKAPA